MKVFCTNPTIISHPNNIQHHENEIPDEALKPNQTHAFYCHVCQMPLMLQRRYVAVEPLGAGGFGMTFRAWDCTQKKDRVIKRLIPRDDLGQKLKDTIQRLFAEEAEVLEHLKHHQIPGLRDHFTEMLPNSGSAELAYYLVQEYVAGRDLDKELKERVQQGKTFSEPEILDLLNQLLDVLKYIHTPRSMNGIEKQVIHRDIKPSNIIRDAQGNYHLIDFGSVRQVVQEGVPANQSIPVTSYPNHPPTIIGTPGFAPPEQFNPGADTQPEPSWDLHALGATCVGLLTGEVLPDLSSLHQLTTWQDKAQVSPQLANILHRMVQSDPAQRYQRADEVLAELNKNPQPTSPSQGIRPKFLWLASSIAAVGLLTLAVILEGISKGQENTPPPLPPSLVPTNQLISVGETRIDGSFQLSGIYEELKQQGIIYFAAGEYTLARDRFDDIRKQAEAQLLDNPTDSEALQALKDPEIVIYRNNAEARLQHAESEPIYTIAVAAPVGTIFPYGQHILFGVAQAQSKALNELGLNLEVVIANDRNNAEQAEEVAKGLANLRVDNERSILAVIGHYLSGATCPALPIYSAQGIVVISSTSTRSNLRQACGGEENELFFRTVSSSAVEADTLVRYVVDSRRSKITDPKAAIFYNPTDDYSKEIFEQFQSFFENRGGTVVGIFELSDPTFDATQALQQVTEANVLVMLADGKNETPDAFNRALEIIQLEASSPNNDVRLILGANSLYLQEVLPEDVAEKLQRKFIIATDWHPECGADSFSNVSNNLWKGDVNRSAALSYEAIQVLFDPFQQGINSRDALRNRLEVISIQSEVFNNKRISFEEDGDRNDIRTRVLTTPRTDGQGFGLLEGESCT